MATRVTASARISVADTDAFEMISDARVQATEGRTAVFTVKDIETGTVHAFLAGPGQHLAIELDSDLEAAAFADFITDGQMTFYDN
jgi:hypothetical protein